MPWRQGTGEDSECGGLGGARGGDPSLQTALLAPTCKGPFSAPDFCLTCLHTRPAGQLFSAEGGFASEGHVWPFLETVSVVTTGGGGQCYRHLVGGRRAAMKQPGMQRMDGPATSRDLAPNVHSAEVTTPP